MLHITMNPITNINKYTYVGNNPIINIDPTGKDFWDVIIGAVVVFAAVATGGLAAAALGGMIGGALGGGITAGIIGGLVGGLAGAAVGGIVGAGLGALSYTWLGRDPTQGAQTFGMLGAAFGGLAGGISGATAGYTGSSSAVFNYFDSQWNLLNTSPKNYFLNIGYDPAPWYSRIGGTLFGPQSALVGNGASLGLSSFVTGITTGLGNPSEQGHVPQ